MCCSYSCTALHGLFSPILDPTRAFLRCAVECPRCRTQRKWCAVAQRSRRKMAFYDASDVCGSSSHAPTASQKRSDSSTHNSGPHFLHHLPLSFQLPIFNNTNKGDLNHNKKPVFMSVFHMTYYSMKNALNNTY